MTVTLPPDVTATDCEDGLVLLDGRTGRYWMLNSTGAATLRLLLSGNSTTDTAAKLAARFPAAEGRADRDVAALLTALRTAKLVTSS